MDRIKVFEVGAVVTQIDNIYWDPITDLVLRGNAIGHVDAVTVIGQ